MLTEVEHQYTIEHTRKIHADFVVAHWMLKRRFFVKSLTFHQKTLHVKYIYDAGVLQAVEISASGESLEKACFLGPGTVAL